MYNSVSFTILVTGNLYQIAIRAFLTCSQTIAGLRIVLNRNRAVLAVLLCPCLPSKRSVALVLGVCCFCIRVLLLFCSTGRRLHWHFPCRACHFCFSKTTPFRGTPKLCPLHPCLKMWSSFQMILSNFIFELGQGGERRENQTKIWRSQILSYVLIFFSALILAELRVASCQVFNLCLQA